MAHQQRAHAVAKARNIWAWGKNTPEQAAALMPAPTAVAAPATATTGKLSLPILEGGANLRTDQAHRHATSEKPTGTKKAS